MKIFIRRGFFGLILLVTIFVTQITANSIEQLAKDYVPKLEKNLFQNFAPLWLSRGLDRDHGGCKAPELVTAKGSMGNNKTIVQQTQCLWFFSKLAGIGYESEKMREAAILGYRFIKENMWDTVNGGFFWEVNADGS